MTEFYLTPTETFDSVSDVYSYINIFNPILSASWDLQYQYDNNKVYMNDILGAEPAPDYLSYTDMRKFSGVYFALYPYVDFSLKQYLVIFKVEKYYGLASNTIEIYHNGDRVATEVLEAGDDRFAIVVDGEAQNVWTNLYFRAASGYPPFWFKEIEVQVL